MKRMRTRKRKTRSKKSEANDFELLEKLNKLVKLGDEKILEDYLGPIMKAILLQYLENTSPTKFCHRDPSLFTYEVNYSWKPSLIQDLLELARMYHDVCPTPPSSVSPSIPCPLLDLMQKAGKDQKTKSESFLVKQEEEDLYSKLSQYMYALVFLPFVVRQLVSSPSTGKGMCFDAVKIEWWTTMDRVFPMRLLGDIKESKKCFAKAKKSVWVVEFVEVSLDKSSKEAIREYHSNVILVDRDKHTIELFEPHGSLGYSAIPTVSIRVLQEFRDFLIRNGYLSPTEAQIYQWMSPLDLCPRSSYQWQSKLPVCAYFSYLYLLIRLLCPTLSREFILTQLTHEKEIVISNAFHALVKQYADMLGSDWDKATQLLVRLNDTPSDPETNATRRFISVGLPKRAIAFFEEKNK